MEVLLAAMALVLNMVFASVALVHGDVADDHRNSGEISDVDWSALLLQPEFVLGNVAFFGILYAVTRRRG